MTFSVKEKLGGLFPIFKSKETELEEAANRGGMLQKIMADPSWIPIQQLFDKYYTECVKILETRNLPEEEWRRINHRAEILADIRRDIQEAIAVGEAATIRLQELKERNNGG